MSKKTAFEDIFGRPPEKKPRRQTHAEEVTEIERMSPDNRVVAIRGRIEQDTTADRKPDAHLVRLARKYDVHYYGEKTRISKVKSQRIPR